MTDPKKFFHLAAEQATLATCHNARCGSVIVDEEGEVIGCGFNAPPRNDESQRMCDKSWELGNKPKYDKTCCVHAEWNAILDACKNAPDKLEGATLYFMRIDNNDQFTQAGDPYCTVCSRLALSGGLRYFALWNDGPDIRPTKEYNQSSYEYHKKV